MSYISRFTPKIIYYRNFKRFDKQKFITDVKNADFSFKTDDPNENYWVLTNVFSLVMEKHIPLKKRTVRRNHAPFITKDIRKAFYTRNKLKTSLLKILLISMFSSYKRQRYKCFNQGKIDKIVFTK